MKLFKAEQWKYWRASPSFEAYRQAYGQAENPERTLAFLTNRMRFNESLFFIAVDENEKAIGFVQLFPRLFFFTITTPIGKSPIFLCWNMRNKQKFMLRWFLKQKDFVYFTQIQSF